MQRIFIDNHDRILYYSNPAGYIAGKEAVVDTMFQTQELERFLQKQSLTIRWEDGVYDRLLLGQRGGRFDPEAPPLKSCRVWQLTRDSPINMRFIPYEALLERFGQPDRKHYETVYDGLVGTNDPEEIYTLFRDPVPGYDGRPIGISDVLELYDQHIRDADGSAVIAGNGVAEDGVDLFQVVGPNLTVIDHLIAFSAWLTEALYHRLIGNETDIDGAVP